MSEETIRERFGHRLSVLREGNNMTQLELAYDLGYNSSGTISLIETGQKAMSFDKIEKVARLFNVSPGFFFDNSDIAETDINLQVVFEHQLSLPVKQRHKLFKPVKYLLRIIESEYFDSNATST